MRSGWWRERGSRRVAYSVPKPEAAVPRTAAEPAGDHAMRHARAGAGAPQTTQRGAGADRRLTGGAATNADTGATATDIRYAADRQVASRSAAAQSCAYMLVVLGGGTAWRQLLRVNGARPGRRTCNLQPTKDNWHAAGVAVTLWAARPARLHRHSCHLPLFSLLSLQLFLYLV